MHWMYIQITILEGIQKNGNVPVVGLLSQPLGAQVALQRFGEWHPDWGLRLAARSTVTIHALLGGLPVCNVYEILHEHISPEVTYNTHSSTSSRRHSGNCRSQCYTHMLFGKKI